MIRIFIFAIIIIAASCKFRQGDHPMLYSKFTDAYYHQGFEQITGFLSDTITLKDGDYVKEYSKPEFRIYYQWDSVFQPHCQILDVKELENSMEVTVSVSSIRFEFLENNPLITRKRIYFEHNKIRKIENIQYLNVDWNTWQSKRDSLVSWVEQNQPELSGFIYDMTKQGAEKYVMAIEYFE